MLPEGAELSEEQLDSKIEQLWSSEPEEPATEQPEEAVEEVEPEEVTEEVKEEVTDENETDEPEKDEGESEDPEKEADKGEALALSQIAEILGVEENDLDVDENGKVVLNTKIDGVEGKVSLAEARKSYQLEGHLNKQNMEVVETRKALEAEREAFRQEQQSKAQQLEDTLNLAYDDLNSEFANVNWEYLRQNEPQEYLLLKNDYAEKQKKLETRYETLQQTRQEQAEQYAKEQESVRVEKVAAETERLRQLIPGWDNDETYQTGAKELQQSCLEHGWSNEEIQAIATGKAVDPEVATRFFIQAHKAAQFDKLQKSQEQVVKKIRSAPKVVAPGTPEPKPKGANVKSEVSKIKKTGEITDEYLKAKGII